MVHNRHIYLQKTLLSIYLARVHPGLEEKFPLFISIDGADLNTTFVAHTNSAAQDHRIGLLNHVQVERCQHDLGCGYRHIAQHYKWVMHVMVRCASAPRLIFLEDDLLVAPDIFPYFSRLSSLLDSDPRLWCVSAWNDNGQSHFVSDPRALYRTDFMPGLGWMLRNDTALELLQIWPDGYWDTWMRSAGVRKGRQCIYPEVSRTYTFGEHGTSNGQFFGEHLAPMTLNQHLEDWQAMDLSYLDERRYDQELSARVNAAEQVTREQLPRSKQGKELKLVYKDVNEFRAIGINIPGLSIDVQGDSLRTAYKGIVTVKLYGDRFYFVPASYNGTLR